MASNPSARPPPPPTSAESGQIGQNIAAVHGFYAREGQNRSGSQRRAEHISEFMGQPAFLMAILVFVGAWMGINGVLPALGRPAPDPAPFFWLQGLVGIAALLIMTVVLTKQNRVDKLAEQRAHLDLKVTLLIEQKTAKLIDLMEELRRDLPNVVNRHDPGAAQMQQALSPEAVLAALDEPAPVLDGPPPA